MEKGGANEELEVWRLHKEHLNDYCENGPKCQGKRNVITLYFRIGLLFFLARTSTRTYKEVAKVMKLPHISFIYTKTTEMVSTVADKGYVIDINTIRTVGERAKREKLTSHQKTGIWLKTLAAYLWVLSTIDQHFSWWQRVTYNWWAVTCVPASCSAS